MVTARRPNQCEGGWHGGTVCGASAGSTCAKLPLQGRTYRVTATLATIISATLAAAPTAP